MPQNSAVEGAGGGKCKHNSRSNASQNKPPNFPTKILNT
jgi:hypothetical protein